MGQWVYLSHVLASNTPSYGGRTGLSIVASSRIAAGDSANSVVLQLPNHLGTHLDAPRHFFENGTTLDSYPASFWQFSDPLLVDCPLEKASLLSIETLVQALDRVGARPEHSPPCLLLRTGFESCRGESAYWSENPGLSPELGAWLRTEWPSIRLIGLDLISATSWRHRETGREAHRALLNHEKPGNPIVILEDMSLSAIPESERLAEMVVLPLRVMGSDGGPCTVIGRLF